MKHLLITGGAGFVGSNLALRFKEYYGDALQVTCLDNLKRRGSELNLTRLKAGGIQFQHGDIRNMEDLEAVGSIDCLIECSAEPSVLAGYGESPRYLINTNLSGTINCLELVRQQEADLVFLSTSRVYPIQTINDLSYTEGETRFHLAENPSAPGVSEQGFSELFPLEGVRSLYGATKLCSEHLIQEYADMYGLRAIINRCGLLTGPWQMGKVDQGVVVLWVARHYFEGHLQYLGYGGQGKQVRDMLHVDDLFQLLLKQLEGIDQHNGQIYNVGGGVEVSASLQELTNLCQQSTGKQIAIESISEDRVADIRCYLSDCSKVQAATGWKPQKSVEAIIEEITTWIQANENDLRLLLAA